MKLFQQLLLAPAALGLVAPLAATAADLPMASSTAAISSYTQQQDLDRFRAWESQNQVTSINQFSEVKPTDWAYQALSNLIERYGCVAGYPNGTFKGGQAMTRFEAAALLNACLDRVTEVTDELQRLINDFQNELSVLKGRVDGLDMRVGILSEGFVCDAVGLVVAADTEPGIKTAFMIPAKELDEFKIGRAHV
jgi:hypothetical protein